MLLSNPIFRREIKTAVRDPKVVLLISGFVLFLGIALAFLWPKTGVYSQRANVGIQVFSIFLVSNLALIILLVPALTSPSITLERERNSYELLFTSLLTPGEILRGKLSSSITMILLVVLVSMPISAICSWSGGIPPSLLVKAMSIILIAALTYGMMGLAISALCSTTFTALITSYLAVVFFSTCTWLPSVLVRSKRFGALLIGMRCMSPFDAMLSILFPARYQQGYAREFAGNNPYIFYWIFVVANMLILTVCLVIFCKYVVSPPGGGLLYKMAAMGLGFVLVAAIVIEVVAIHDQFNDVEARREQLSSRMTAARGKAKGKGKRRAKSKAPASYRMTHLDDEKQQLYLICLLLFIVDAGIISVIRALLQKAKHASQQYEDYYEDTGTAVKRKLTWPFYLIDPLKRKKPIGRFRNPVFVAEMRSQLFGKPRFVVYGLTTCVSFSMLLLIMTCVQFGEWLRPENVLTVAIIFQVGIISVLAPAISSGAITNEIAARTFPMLRMTPIPITNIVFGKLKASFAYVSIFLVSSLPVLFALAYLDYSDKITGFQAFWRVGAWLAILFVVTICFISAGFCCSSFCRETSTATAMSYGVAATICIITLAGLIPDALPENIQHGLLLLNPIIVAVRLTSPDSFTYLPGDAWVTNLMCLGGLSMAAILISCGRVYYIFIKRT